MRTIVTVSADAYYIQNHHGRRMVTVRLFGTSFLVDAEKTSLTPEQIDELERKVATYSKDAVV